MRTRTLTLVFSLVSLVIGVGAPTGAATTWDRLTPEDGLSRVGFTHLAMNDAGDFVGVSHTKVYVGNAETGAFQEIHEEGDASFVISNYQSIYWQQARLTHDMDVYGTRLALNESGSFVLASNTMLFVGNARDGSIRKVFTGERFQEFQQVALNDAGHFIALSTEQIVAGTVGAEAPLPLIDSTLGSFAVYGVWDSSGSIDVVTGETHVALNASGQFVAASSGALYTGSVPGGAVEKLLEERFIGFRHVALGANGHFTAVTDDDVFAGNIE